MLCYGLLGNYTMYLSHGKNPVFSLFLYFEKERGMQRGRENPKEGSALSVQSKTQSSIS